MVVRQLHRKDELTCNIAFLSFREILGLTLFCASSSSNFFNSLFLNTFRISGNSIRLSPDDSTSPSPIGDTFTDGTAASMDLFCWGGAADDPELGGLKLAIDLNSSMDGRSSPDETADPSGIAAASSSSCVGVVGGDPSDGDCMRLRRFFFAAILSVTSFWLEMTLPTYPFLMDGLKTGAKAPTLESRPAISAETAIIFIV